MTSREKRLELHYYNAHSRRIALVEFNFQRLWMAAYEAFKKERDA